MPARAEQGLDEQAVLVGGLLAPAWSAARTTSSRAPSYTPILVLVLPTSMTSSMPPAPTSPATTRRRRRRPSGDEQRAVLVHVHRDAADAVDRDRRPERVGQGAPALAQRREAFRLESRPPVVERLQQRGQQRRRGSTSRPVASRTDVARSASSAGNARCVRLTPMPRTTGARAARARAGSRAGCRRACGRRPGRRSATSERGAHAGHRAPAPRRPRCRPPATASAGAPAQARAEDDRGQQARAGLVVPRAARAGRARPLWASATTTVPSGAPSGGEALKATACVDSTRPRRTSARSPATGAAHPIQLRLADELVVQRLLLGELVALLARRSRPAPAR